MNRQRLIRLTIACAILALAAVLLHGYITDDTYIHLRYAEHLLARGEFSFNPGESTYGATSPLWILGLALLLALGLAPTAATWLLGLLCGLLVLLVLEVLLSRLRWPPVWTAALLWLAAADAWFLRWTMSGMETPLVVVLSLLLLWPLGRREKARIQGNGGGAGLGASASPAAAPDSLLYLAWGAAAGLAALTRPEFILLGPLTVPWLLRYEHRRDRRRNTASSGNTWRRLFLAASGWLLVLGPWWYFAWRTFGRLTPETAAAKSYAIAIAPAQWLSTVLHAARQLGATQGFLWLALFILGVLALAGARGQGIASVSSRRNGLASTGPQNHRRTGTRSACGPDRAAGTALIGIALTWSVVLVGGYALKQVWLISRYLAPLSIPLLLAVAVLVKRLLNRLEANPDLYRAGCVSLCTCVVLALAANTWLLVDKVRPHAIAFSRGVEECYRATGDWLRQNSEQKAQVAALDIGTVGYASERRVLDLMGLVSPELLDLGHELGFEEMVASGAWLDVTVPDYLVDRTEGSPRWAGRTVRGVHFELLRTCEIAGVGLREPQPWTVALYRLTPASR